LVFKQDKLKKVKSPMTSVLRWTFTTFYTANTVRTHWAIQNLLHWVLDVSFREEASHIHKDNPLENMAMLRHLSLNLLGRNKSSKSSIRAKRNKAAWDLDYLRTYL